ncbi:PEP-CTERM protein-sorting domain-containing protein [Prosthecobacter debontii]|uniref:PEP-CTERM protein-sorting domain-containing protein n=1 Tax=Prosthecobacter debontii TaxID=48467 RepID=A0A1T4YD31_9BACT|nr:PEP-CTERM protein-sorting domain-containing protein [Prosthecobacter debontii]
MSPHPPCLKKWSAGLVLGLALVIGVPKVSSASTLLLSHTGAANPTTEGWTFSGTVETGAITNDQDSGVDAWRVYEQGGGVSHAGTYNKTLTTTQLSDAVLTGWTMDATIRFVPPDSLANTPLSNNAWCTFLVDEGVAGKRDLYGIYFGSDTSGNTLVRLYSFGSTYTVSPGYHDYKLSWDPETGLASFFIDGEFKTSYSGTTIDNTGTSRVYWGDNTTTVADDGRGAHYAYVGLTVGTAAAMAPEPTRVAFFVLASLGCLLRRQRMIC